MSDIHLYFYSGCSSCRNAEMLLKELGAPYQKHEFFKHRFTAEQLSTLLDEIGKSPRDVLSTRSRPYKELGLAARNPDDHELIALMIEHPQLLKRPLTVRGADSVIGYNKGAITALVKGGN